MLLGGVDFSDLAVQLKAARGDQPAVLIQYGAFINQVLDLLIIAGAIFIVIKVMNRIRRSKPKDPGTKKCPECQMDVPVAAKKCGHCTSAL
jgi:large conductance mechanosensitive channel